MADPAALQSTSRTVFVGNIPFDATESQIREILNTVGPLQNLRLVHDAKTGKPKGYGFAEYLDPHTAQSAIRNLNNADLNGRSLRVDSADDDKPLGERGRKAPSSAPLTAAAPSDSSSSRARFSLGSAQSPYTALPLTPDAISSVVQSLSKQQRLDLLIETKRLALANPEAAQQLLVDHPPLAHLLLQCQLLYGLVTPDEIHALTLHPPTQHMPPPTTAPPTPMPATLQPYAAQAPPPPPHPYGVLPAAGMPSPEEILARLPPLPPQQREIVVELLKLTPEELRGLPAEAQQQVKDILQRIGIGR